MTSPWSFKTETRLYIAQQIVDSYFHCLINIEEALARFDSLIKQYEDNPQLFEDNICDVKNENKSINIISDIAIILSEKFNLYDGNGVVLTPYIIAADMVRMCLYEWLCTNLPTHSKTFYLDLLWETTPERIPNDVTDAIQSLSWFDPCVGTGVFIGAVIDTYNRFGLSAPIVAGYDINPFFVSATKHMIRTSKLKVKDSGIQRGDSLKQHLNLISLFSLDNEWKSYDIVIGNPPYVQFGNIQNREEYCQLYPEISGKKADLYTFFIANGMNTLSANGVLGFITPAQFQKSNYGRQIRKLINKVGSIRCIFDFNELPVFDNVSVHTSIFCIAKGKVQEDFVRYEYSELPESTPLLLGYREGQHMAAENISGDVWSLSSTNAYEILGCFEMGTIPLKTYTEGVFSGIKSGCKPAFFIKETDIKTFSSNELQYIEKMILPKNIRTWEYSRSGEYMIVIPKDVVIDTKSPLFHHMAKYKALLEKRDDTKKHQTWYGLRECNYYDKLRLPKIIYPDIATECRFAMDLDGMFIPDGAFFIPGENYYLLGLLNSCIGRYYFREKCARIGNPAMGGRVRFKKVYVENFPVKPFNNDKQACNIRMLAIKMSESGYDSAIQRELDEAVLTLYDIPKKHYKEILEA